MNAQVPDVQLLDPPVALPGFHKNDWFAIAPADPVVAYIVEQLWCQQEPPLEWEAARLSKAAYLYREKTTQWTVLVKFYSAKVRTAEAACLYAANEFRLTQQAEAFGWTNKAVQAPHALACWRGALFLEHIDGLTLEDTIAIRRNRPGMLMPALEKITELLSGLHSQCPQPAFACNFQNEIMQANKFAEELAEKGVLEGNQIVVDALERLIENWARDPMMIDYIPTFIHGDATTSNFVLPWNGGLVAVDWERMWTADPASELGRLFAEVAHSIGQYGGDYQEAEQLLQFSAQAYCQRLPCGWDREALLHRTRFYQASSTLRIARNGWLPPSQRTGLVAQALALLA